MLSDILQPVLETVFEIAFYYFGRLVIPVVLLGRWHCDPLFSNVPKREKRWGGLFHYCAGFIYFTSEGTAAIGGIFAVIIVSLGIWLRYG